MPDTDHLAALSAAIDDELAWEAAEHRRLCALPLVDRIAAGLTWPSTQLRGLTRQWRGARLTLATAGRAALHDGITPGDLITIAPIATPDRPPAALVSLTTLTDHPTFYEHILHSRQSSTHNNR